MSVNAPLDILCCFVGANPAWWLNQWSTTEFHTLYSVSAFEWMLISQALKQVCFGPFHYGLTQSMEASARYHIATLSHTCILQCFHWYSKGGGILSV